LKKNKENKMNYSKIALGTLAYFISSFVILGILGFVIAGEYFLSISIMRQSPLIYLSMPATILTGIAVAILYPMTNLKGTPVLRGFKFGLLTGLIIVPFVALDIPGRFNIPSVATWILNQGLLGIMQSAIAGILIGLIYGKDMKEG
jgi:hypothetical protein